MFVVNTRDGIRVCAGTNQPKSPTPSLPSSPFAVMPRVATPLQPQVIEIWFFDFFPKEKKHRCTFSVASAFREIHVAACVRLLMHTKAQVELSSTVGIAMDLK